MNPELAAVVDRLARWTAYLAVARDDAYRTGRIEHAWRYGASARAAGDCAAVAVDAGLCDIATALDYDSAREITGSPRPSAEHYAAAIVRAVESNR